MDESTNPLEKLVQSGNQKDKETPGRNWVGGLVAGVLVLILTAVFGFMAWRRGRKMAELLHKEALAEEALKRAKVDADLEEHAEMRSDLVLDAHILEQELEALKRERESYAEKYQESRSRLDSLTSWDDIDAYLRPTEPGLPGAPNDPD